jgi:hypothetical protein
MAQLNFKGKQFVQNYHFSVPFRIDFAQLPFGVYRM